MSNTITAMATLPQTYFTCTLGEAAQWNLANPPPFATLNELVDWAASAHPEEEAFGFAEAGSQKQDADHPFTFASLQTLSLQAASLLSRTIKDRAGTASQVCFGLMSKSNADFVWMWLGLIRLGYSVLLITYERKP
jgi:hypothetical protein